MASIDEHILKTAKEVVVKFIECGRLSRPVSPKPSRAFTKRWMKP